MATPEIPSVQTIAGRIQSDIESKINQDVPALLLSFVKILSFSVAGGIFLLYVALLWVYKQIFPQDADYDNLIKHGDIVDVKIKDATFAELTANMPGSGTSAPVGGIFRGPNQVAYKITVATPIVGGIASNVPIKALQSGTIGNLANGEALVANGVIPGLDGTATITGTTIDGSNRQSRESYKEAVETRYKTKFIYGSPAGYAQSGLETPNFIWVGPYADPDFPGNTIIYGRVDLSLGTNGIPTTDQLNQLETYCRFDPETGLEVRRPINDSIDPRPVFNREFDIVINIQNGTAEIKADIITRVAAYMQTLEPYIQGVSISRNDTLTNSDIVIVSDDIATASGAKITLVSITDVLLSAIVNNYVLYGGEFAIARNITFIDVA